MPNIPIGFATKIGVVAAFLLGIVALAVGLAADGATPETISALAGAVALLYKVMDGRYNQAVVQATEKAVPDEAELEEMYPGEREPEPVIDETESPS